MSETSEDVAPQSHETLQSDVCLVRGTYLSPTIQKAIKFCDFPEPYLF